MYLNRNQANFVLCIVYCAFCIMHWLLWIVHFAFWIVHCALTIGHFAFLICLHLIFTSSNTDSLIKTNVAMSRPFRSQGVSGRHILHRNGANRGYSRLYTFWCDTTEMIRGQKTHTNAQWATFSIIAITFWLQQENIFCSFTDIFCSCVTIITEYHQEFINCFVKEIPLIVNKI